MEILTLKEEIASKQVPYFAMRCNHVHDPGNGVYVNYSGPSPEGLGSPQEDAAV